VVGAYILVQKSILEKSGLFDEDFFMYAEEIEWCARLRKQGKLILFAAPKIIHIGGGTSSDYYSTEETENGKNLWNKKGRQIIVSNMLRIRKQFGIGWFLLIFGMYVIEIPLFVFCLLIDKSINKGKVKYSWQNVKDYTANILVLMRYFFIMLQNKKYFYKVA
jgi:GT2 family glycosyltransferase